MSKLPGISFLALLLCFGSHSIWAQTDVAASVYGVFSPSVSSSPTSADMTAISPSNAAGFLFELRHIKNPIFGYEATYSFNRANQSYSHTFYPPCPALQGSCGPTRLLAAIPANAHEVTADWLVSLKLASFRPFALAGGGLLLTVPRSGSVPATSLCGTALSGCSGSTTLSTTRHTTGVFVYGLGVDWALLPHIGLRFQYRGNVYKAPNLVKSFSSLDRFTHNAEPMAGVFFQF